MTATTACEIELKAHVRDVERVRAFLKAHAVFRKKYFKRDRYFFHPPDESMDSLLRLRNANGSHVFTSKKRHMERSVEINEETEMSVRKNDARKIVRFITGVLGYRDYVIKEKKGRAYSYRGVRIELSEVSPLGHFVEIEILDGTSSAEEQIALLHSILADLGIPESDIETTPYVALLRTPQ
ncbi:MAG: class IV adenylate cyclase [Spirochaetota bacterium]